MSRCGQHIAHGVVAVGGYAVERIDVVGHTPQSVINLEAVDKVGRRVTAVIDTHPVTNRVACRIVGHLSSDLEGIAGIAGVSMLLVLPGGLVVPARAGDLDLSACSIVAVGRCAGLTQIVTAGRVVDCGPQAPLATADHVAEGIVFDMRDQVA